MNFNEFTQHMKDAVTMKHADVTVTTASVTKNNGVIYHGINIRKQDSVIAPTIYLDGWYDEYLEGTESLDRITERVLNMYENAGPVTTPDLSFFHEFDAVSDRIVFKLINYERNSEILSRSPHKRFLDMAIVFQYLLKDGFPGNGFIHITNDHMERWEVSAEELYDIAMENTPRILPGHVENIMETIASIMRMRNADPAEFENIPDTDGYMYVASNTSGVNGCSTMLYPDFLESFAKEHDSDFFILPCSVHELIFLPDSGDMNGPALEEMVYEVNDTQVGPEDYLSNHVYYYRKGSLKPEIFFGTREPVVL